MYNNVHVVFISKTSLRIFEGCKFHRFFDSLKICKSKVCENQICKIDFFEQICEI